MLPWFRHLWLVLPFGDEVQFPWRLLGYAGLFAAVGLGVWWRSAMPDRRGMLLVALAIVAAMPFALTAQRHVTPELDVPIEPPRLRAIDKTSTAMDEYLPKTVAELPPGPRDSLLHSHDLRTVEIRERDRLHFELALDATAAGTVTLAQFAFPGWRVETLEGPSSAVLATSQPSGFLQIQLPRAGTYRVVVGFGRTRFWTFAALVSLFALATVVPLLGRIRRLLDPSGDVMHRPLPR